MEIIAGACSTKGLYAWTNKGQPLSGWPNEGVYIKGLPSLGNLEGGSEASEIFSAFQSRYDSTYDLEAFKNNGQKMSGWPRQSSNYMRYPAALYDIDKDGIDEIFTAEESSGLSCYKANGGVCSGWPSDNCNNDQSLSTPAIGDLNNDGKVEIFSTASLVGTTNLCGYQPNGRNLPGFPKSITSLGYTSGPVIGDIDGDGQKEVVINYATKDGGMVGVYSMDGGTKKTFPTKAQQSYWLGIALADIDQDSLPEIIIQGDKYVSAQNADGSDVPGWPVEVDKYLSYSNSSPVVGDIDGDGNQDVVMSYINAGSLWKPGYVYAFKSDGQMLSSFPIVLSFGDSGTPAIADIDQDSRNELIIIGQGGEKVAGGNNKVWVYDLNGKGPYGGIEWGQYMGGMKRNGLYAPTAGFQPKPKAVITIYPPKLPDARIGKSYNGQLKAKTASDTKLTAKVSGLPKNLKASCSKAAKTITCNISGSVARTTKPGIFNVSVLVTSSDGTSETFTVPLTVVR